MAMGIQGKLLGCLLLLCANVFAQNAWQTNHTAATAPVFQVSGGYTYISMTSPSNPRVGLTGVDGDAVLQINRRWGAMADVTFARAASIPGTGHGDMLFSGLVGPVFYLKDGLKTGVFVHALAGMAVVNSAVLLTPTTVFHGYETRFSYDFGGGYEHMVTGPFGISIKGDYQRTQFVDHTLALQGRNNLRITTGLLYRFGSH
jgi:hypothetical protein